MIHWIADLKLLHKIALPIMLLLLVVGVIIFKSYSGLTDLTEIAENVVDVSAKRLELSMTVFSEANNATIAEKNAILEDEPSHIKAYADSYKVSIKIALDTADQMIAMSDTPERRAINQQIKDQLLTSQRISQEVLGLAAVYDREGAFKQSSGEGREALKAIQESITKRINANHADMARAKQLMDDRAHELLISLGLVSGLGVLGALTFLSWIVSANVVKPFAGITQAMQDLAAGNLEAPVLGHERKDEVGSLARSLQVFKEGAIERRRLEDRERADVAAREARQVKIDNATKRFDATIVAMMAKIKGTVEHLHTSADALSANAEQTQRQSTAVAAATDQATANVETVSSAGAELTASIHEISRQVQQSAQITRTASDEVQDANSKIGGLSEAAQKIGEVVSLINDIASQTNLLALNATIESARAGEAGKGFAVVANEVKHLAGQTGRATDEIGQQIASVQEETRAAVASIGGIFATITQINELATVIAGAVEEQGAATAEISRNVEQASQGTREVASNIAGVAQAAAETGRMAQGVFKSANELLAESDTLEHEVQRFLKDVREA